MSSLAFKPSAAEFYISKCASINEIDTILVKGTSCHPRHQAQGPSTGISSASAFLDTSNMKSDDWWSVWIHDESCRFPYMQYTLTSQSTITLGCDSSKVGERCKGIHTAKILSFSACLCCCAPHASPHHFPPTRNSPSPQNDFKSCTLHHPLPDEVLENLITWQVNSFRDLGWNWKLSY